MRIKLWQKQKQNLCDVYNIFIISLVDKNKVALVDGYIEQLDCKVKENSNMAFSLQGLNNYIAN